MAYKLCDTNTTVLPLRTSASIRSSDLRWNDASPTDSTSSTSRMSGSMCAATAKPSRAYMPDE